MLLIGHRQGGQLQTAGHGGGAEGAKAAGARRRRPGQPVPLHAHPVRLVPQTGQKEEPRPNGCVLGWASGRTAGFSACNLATWAVKPGKKKLGKNPVNIGENPAELGEAK